MLKKIFYNLKIQEKITFQFARKVNVIKQRKMILEFPDNDINSLKLPNETSQIELNQQQNYSSDDSDIEMMLPQKKIEQNEIIDKDAIKFIQETLVYRGEDAFPEKLVTRPEKGVVWGLGGELMRVKQNMFKYGKMPTVEEIKQFLELEQSKDIKIVDLKELGRTDLPNYGIIATTYSSRHNYRVANNLVNALKKLNIKNLINQPRLHGRKDDEWYNQKRAKDISIHLK